MEKSNHNKFNSLIKSNSNLMKNLNFLVKSLMFVACLFVSNSLVAQSFDSSPAGASYDANLSVDLDDVNLVDSDQAVITLENSATVLRDAHNNPAVEENNADFLKMYYYRHLQTEIEEGATVKGALQGSGAFLVELFTKNSNLKLQGFSTTDILEDAVELLSL